MIVGHKVWGERREKLGNGSGAKSKVREENKYQILIKVS